MREFLVKTNRRYQTNRILKDLLIKWDCTQLSSTPEVIKLRSKITHTASTYSSTISPTLYNLSENKVSSLHNHKRTFQRISHLSGIAQRMEVSPLLWRRLWVIVHPNSSLSQRQSRLRQFLYSRKQGARQALTQTRLWKRKRTWIEIWQGSSRSAATFNMT